MLFELYGFVDYKKEVVINYDLDYFCDLGFCEVWISFM